MNINIEHEMPDYKVLEKDVRLLIDHAEMLAEGHGVSGLKGNRLAMDVANTITLLIDEIERNIKNNKTNTENNGKENK